MNDLVFTVLRLGFLIVLWLLVLSIVGALRRDLAIGSRARVGNPSAREIRKDPSLASPPEAPAKQQAKTLVVLEGPLTGLVHQLTSRPILLGRAQEATIVLEDDYASGRHARLFPQGTRWFIEDLGSTNGTFLGESQLTRAQPVELGQKLRIGKTVMELRP